jgi:hypothetical protein
MRATLVNQAVSAAAAIAVVPASSVTLNDAPRKLTAQFTFTYGSGGTTLDAYLQTSFDGGLTWVDLIHFAATTSALKSVYNLSSMTPQLTAVTPTDGTMTTPNLDGLLGPMYQVKLKSSGTYAGATNLRVDISTGDQ